MRIYLKKQYCHKGDQSLDREVFGHIMRPFQPDMKTSIDQQIKDGKLLPEEVIWEKDLSTQEIMDYNLEIFPHSFKRVVFPPIDLVMKFRTQLEVMPINDGLTDGCILWSAFCGLDRVKLKAALDLFDDEQHMIAALMGWYEWFSATLNQEQFEFGDDGTYYFEFLTTVVAPAVLNFLVDYDHFPVNVDDFDFVGDMLRTWERLSGEKDASIQGS